ncbi:MAG: hypothetical protein NC344_06210 [Bacteroidales bacterium]|nr:hypothetical protein [Bacteroidales bacterium]MCM1147411.1 hypothetical protein [Bacteroidales bacterium]MCM1206080.1 hypothetical protein [Bacillota bacterium]MCM1510089.1 hypothetical protein [Clostridium sp.]
METHKRGIENEEKVPNNKVFLIRQILNVIFMVGAIVGGLLYWFQPEPTLGILVIMTSMFFKMAECVLRFRK